MSIATSTSWWRYGKFFLCEDCAGAVMESCGIERLSEVTHDELIKRHRWQRVCDWQMDHEEVSA